MDACRQTTANPIASEGGGSGGAVAAGILIPLFLIAGAMFAMRQRGITAQNLIRRLRGLPPAVAATVAPEPDKPK